MFEILIISAILAYATLGIGHALSKIGSHSCSVSNSSYSPMVKIITRKFICYLIIIQQVR